MAIGNAKFARAARNALAAYATSGEAARSLREARAGSEGARLMLRRLTEDFAALIRSMDRAIRN